MYLAAGNQPRSGKSGIPASLGESIILITKHVPNKYQTLPNKYHLNRSKEVLYDQYNNNI